MWLFQVAAGEVDMAIGGDQGGSIRLPASWCGIVGLKPTFSLVPFTGAIGLYPQIDHLGPMARTVTDCATLLQVYYICCDSMGGLMLLRLSRVVGLLNITSFILKVCRTTVNSFLVTLFHVTNAKPLTSKRQCLHFC